MQRQERAAYRAAEAGLAAALGAQQHGAGSGAGAERLFARLQVGCKHVFAWPVCLHLATSNAPPLSSTAAGCIDACA